VSGGLSRWPGPFPCGVLDIAQRHLGREVRPRTAGFSTLRVLSLFVSDIRALLPMVPHYLGPIQYDGAKLRKLLGEIRTTPYQEAIPRTLDWLARRQTATA